MLTLVNLKRLTFANALVSSGKYVAARGVLAICHGLGRLRQSTGRSLRRLEGAGNPADPMTITDGSLVPTGDVVEFSA